MVEDLKLQAAYSSCHSNESFAAYETAHIRYSEVHQLKEALFLLRR